MLIRINDEIINTDYILSAEFSDKESKANLNITMAGGGYRGNSLSSKSYSEDAARELWKVLNKLCEEVIVAEQGEDDSKPGTEGMRFY